MSADFISTQDALQAVGWALVHFVWQGALVAILFTCFSSLTKSATANVRYAGACVALTLMLALPLATAVLAMSSSRGLFMREEISSSEGTWTDSARERMRAERGIKSSDSPAPPAEGQAVLSSTATLRDLAAERLTILIPWLTLAWLAGVLLLASRLAGGWLLVLRLRRSATPVAEHLEEILARVSGRLRVGRAVRLCRSALVEAPAVVGHLRPIILIPASAITGLTPEQLEAVLAHELAHVRRYDYLANILQTAVETLLFYHPAVWWLSRRLRVEREHACDDAAVEAIGGDVLLYARALAALETLRAPRAHAAALALAATGGSLMQRIQRLVRLNGRTDDTNARTRSSLVAVALLAVLVCTALACARALVPIEANSSRGAVASDKSAPRREVAVTLVNFPGNNIYSIERLNNKTRKLVRGLAANGVKAVAFVNEARLYKEDGTPDDERIALLREWLDAGHELGNETFSHKSLYNSSVAEFKAEVEQGEKIMSELMRERGGRLRYFSYPYLNTGASPEAKAAVEEYLRGRGYRVHPVTIDNMDWLFNKAYIEALRREDDAAAARIRAEYVPYMERMFEFTENYSREVVGREFPQVLMLTAGALNADCFEELAAMIKRRGYTFVTMEQAMKDEAYSLPDTYVGKHGDSWIARWAVSKGIGYKDTEEENLGGYMQQYFADYLKQSQAKREAPVKK
jgi:beta-lactamase regulating signal transducer with metallopeptidase domain/peptidoglycan/xylan/chitin deacetylase (PgdA/CDA1 family)